MLLSALIALPDVGQVDTFAEPWRRLYSHSSLVSTVVLFGHLGGLLAGGGLALASDRATLRIALDHDDDERRRHLADLAHLRRPVLAALGIAIATGALLFLADVEAFAASPIFWAKMAVVSLLLANGVSMVRVEDRLRDDPVAGIFESAPAVRDRLWKRRRASALANVVLWVVLVLAGTALAAH